MEQVAEECCVPLNRFVSILIAIYLIAWIKKTNIHLEKSQFPSTT